MQRVGFPNVSIKLYEDYSAWLDHRFIEMGASFITMTLRDSLRGVNEGLLQIYDNKGLHTRLTGNEIIQISLSTANTTTVLNRIYGISHNNVTIDQKSDNIITLQLKPIHAVKNLKFSRGTETNAVNNMVSMMDAIYRDYPLWKPAIGNMNVFVPKCPWVSGINDYFEFVRKHGMSVDNESFVYVWEDFKGINITDHETMVKSQEPRPVIVMEPRLMGEFVGLSETLMVYDFEWMTKNNAVTKQAHKNMTYYTFDFITKQYNRIVVGNGENSALFTRSGAYHDLTYKNAFLEGSKLATFAQMDSYAKCTTYGNFEISPSNKLRFLDTDRQIRTDFYVDEVVHEISREQSLTHIYMFSNSEILEDVEFEGKV